MDNLEPPAGPLLAEYPTPAPTHAREEVHPGSQQDVELYLHTYTTMLRSSGEVKIKALVGAHVGAAPSLHSNANAPTPDMDAFLYSVNRLPACIAQVRRVLLGQSAAVFRRHQVEVARWQSVSAPGRRRLWYYDGHDRLAVYVNSASDVDDLIPTLTGYQIEWNKLH